MRRDHWKHWMDPLLAAAGIVILFPLEVGTALICALSGEGVLYCQERIGKDGVPFRLYKFRTMRRDAPVLPRDKLAHPEAYYIPGGAFLRSTGLDELPQLFCVLRGEMNLIGPRPLLAAEVQMHRLRERAGVYALRPGITGLAQLCGDPAPLVKAKLDALYLKERSIFLDGAILLSTLRLVLEKRGKGKFSFEKIGKNALNLWKRACNLS